MDDRLKKAEAIVEKTVIECAEMLKEMPADEAARKRAMRALVEKFANSPTQLRTRHIAHNAPWLKLLAR